MLVISSFTGPKALTAISTAAIGRLIPIVSGLSVVKLRFRGQPDRRPPPRLERGDARLGHGSRDVPVPSRRPARLPLPHAVHPILQLAAVRLGEAVAPVGRDRARHAGRALLPD